MASSPRGISATLLCRRIIVAWSGHSDAVRKSRSVYQLRPHSSASPLGQSWKSKDGSVRQSTRPRNGRKGTNACRSHCARSGRRRSNHHGRSDQTSPQQVRLREIDREPNGERALVRLRSREYPSSSVTCTCSKSMDSSSCARCAGTSHLIELVSFS
jgi:hypothetical protein